MNLLLSLAALLLAAWVLARLLKPTGLPPLLGMMVGGALVANLLPGDLLPRDLPLGTLTLDSIAAEVRLAVLAVVLLRAGLGLSQDDFRHAGSLALRLGTLPLLGDALLLSVGARLLLDLSWPAAIVLGLTVAAISPAIVIPGVLEMLERRRGDDRRVPAALLAGAPLDNVFCLIALGVALELALGTGETSWAMTLLKVPYQVGVGVLVGVLAGILFGRGARGLGRSWQILLMWLLAGLLVGLGKQLAFSFVLAIIALGSTVRTRAPDEVVALSEGLGRVWGVAQYALFGLIGAALDVKPLAQVGLLVAGVIALGQAGRAVGSLVATARAGLGGRERAACLLSYVPKATIQAAFGAMAKDAGLPAGDLILTAAVLSIAICAPLGVVGLVRGADRLLPGGEEPEPDAGSASEPTPSP